MQNDHKETQNDHKQKQNDNKETQNNHKQKQNDHKEGQNERKDSVWVSCSCVRGEPGLYTFSVSRHFYSVYKPPVPKFLNPTQYVGWMWSSGWCCSDASVPNTLWQQTPVMSQQLSPCLMAVAWSTVRGPVGPPPPQLTKPLINTSLLATALTWHWCIVSHHADPFKPCWVLITLNVGQYFYLYTSST